MYIYIRRFTSFPFCLGKQSYLPGDNKCKCGSLFYQTALFLSVSLWQCPLLRSYNTTNAHTNTFFDRKTFFTIEHSSWLFTLWIYVRLLLNSVCSPQNSSVKNSRNAISKMAIASNQARNIGAECNIELNADEK